MCSCSTLWLKVILSIWWELLLESDVRWFLKTALSIYLLLVFEFMIIPLTFLLYSNSRREVRGCSSFFRSLIKYVNTPLPSQWVSLHMCISATMWSGFPSYYRQVIPIANVKATRSQLFCRSPSALCAIQYMIKEKEFGIAVYWSCAEGIWNLAALCLVVIPGCLPSQLSG